jgi:hypothetical protein
MRGRSRGGSIGGLLVGCLLFLLCIALPTVAQAGKPHHRSLLGRRAAPRDRGALVSRRKAPINRHRTWVYERRALTPRRGAPTGGDNVIDPQGVWIDPLPSAELASPASPPASDPQAPIRGGVASPSEGKNPPPVTPPAEAEEPTPEPPPAEAEEAPSAPPVEAENPPPAEPEAPAPEPPPAEAEEPTPEPPPAEAEKPSSAVYWGASIGDQLTGTQAPWDMSAVSKFEGLAGKKLSLVNFFVPFANCSSSPCSFYKFAPEIMESIRQHGAIPVYSWSSQSIPSSLNEPDFQLADVISGSYDSYIREFAEDARAWGHPFFLRFDWEMNGGWFPWAEGANGNQAGEFVTAWRHVHDIFAAAGATNVNWVWAPNVDPDGIFGDLGSLYPGDQYVDWTGLDGYNWGTNPAKPDRWRSFDELYNSTYHRIVDAIAPSKSLLIGEIGSSEYGGSKASWIQDALAKIPANYPKIGGMLWFDTYDDGMDWPIESSTAATSAFAEGIKSPQYANNAYAGLAGSPIQPPH